MIVLAQGAPARREYIGSGQVTFESGPLVIVVVVCFALLWLYMLSLSSLLLSSLLLTQGVRQAGTARYIGSGQVTFDKWSSLWLYLLSLSSLLLSSLSLSQGAPARREYIGSGQVTFE